MIDKLSDAIAELLPPSLRDELRDELRANIKATVAAHLEKNAEKMNLLTREQFEIQEKVLHRTRERVVALEEKVGELEGRLNIAAGKK